MQRIHGIDVAMYSHRSRPLIFSTHNPGELQEAKVARL